MRNLSKLAALLLVLCAARAGALGGNATNAHQHDKASTGGSTLRPVVLSMAAASTATLAGALTISPGAVCSGIACRVGYSSGTANGWSFVVASSAALDMSFAVYYTTGGITARDLMVCVINGDATAGHYYSNYFGQDQNTSQVYNGINAFYPLGGCGTGAPSAGDATFGVLHISSYLGFNFLNFNLNAGSSCANRTRNSPSSGSGWYVGAAPYTITCRPNGAAQGISYEAILYQVGK